MVNSKDYNLRFIKKYSNLVFWLPVLLTIVLTYGYWLTNASVGIDDPASVFYFDWKIWLSQGRFFDEVISWFIDISKFLPGWQNWIALIIFILSGLIWIIFLDRIVEGNLSIVICTLFMCSYLSFPYLSDIFVIDIAAPYGSLSALLAALAAICVQNYYADKKKVKLLFCSVLLALGLGCFENSLFYFMVGIGLGNTLWLFSEKEKQTYKYYLYFIFKQFFIYVFVIVSAFIINRCLLCFFLNKYNLPLSLAVNTYASGYIKYNYTQNIFTQFFSVIISACKQIKTNNDLTSKLLIFNSIIYLFLSCIKGIRSKKVLPVIISGAVIILNFSLIIITGNLDMPHRTLTHYGLYISGLWVVCFEAIKESFSKVDVKKILGCLILICGFWGTLKQSQDMARVFYADTVRYQWDYQKAVLIDYLIQKDGMDLSKPIVFIGTCDEYTSLPYKIPYGSYFSSWDSCTLAEFNNYIRYFLANCGYQYLTPNAEQLKQGYHLSKNISETFPQDESIREYEDLIVVKFNNKIYSEYD